jgi:hypothetical protein
MLLVAFAVLVMAAQMLFGQAPAQGPGTTPEQGPGGRGARGAGRGATAAPPAGPVRRTKEGKPDLTGYWIGATKTNINNGRGGIINPDTRMPDGKIPYNPEWEAKAADTAKNHMFEEPYAHCLPAGIPTNLGLQFGFQIVQDKNTLAWGWDTVGATRLIYLDNRKHIPASIKLYQGDSIGHWEGDTLVVDTTSQAAGWWDASGAVHSDAVHVVERFTPKDENTIAYEALVEDPIALTRPMTVTDTLRRNGITNVPNAFKNRPTGYEQMETACVEGERDTALYTESGGGFAKDGTPGQAAPPGALSTPPPRGGGARGARGGPPQQKGIPK